MTNEELYRQYLSGDTEAFEQLYLQMQGFIASVAKDAAQSFGCSAKETLDELCAEGALELCECLSIGVYDEDRGKLTTYLHPFLRGKMYRYLEANLGAAVLPKDEMQRLKPVSYTHLPTLCRQSLRRASWTSGSFWCKAGMRRSSSRHWSNC